MLKGGNPLTVGVGIIIEVIRKNNSDYDPEVGAGVENIPSSRDPIYLGTLLRLFASHVPDFMKLIQSHGAPITSADGKTKEYRKELKVAFGGSIEPLGFDRFKTCELMAELLHCSNMGLLNEKGGERYVKERDRERERLKAERLQLALDSSQHDISGSTEEVVVEKAPLQVQNGGIELSDDGMNEEDFEDVTISGVLDDSRGESEEGMSGSMIMPEDDDKKREGDVFGDENAVIDDDEGEPETPKSSKTPSGSPPKAESKEQHMGDAPPPLPKDTRPGAEASVTTTAPSPPMTTDDDETLQKNGRTMIEDLNLDEPAEPPLKNAPAAIPPPEPTETAADLPELRKETEEATMIAVPPPDEDEEENLMDLSDGSPDTTINEGDVSVRSLGSVGSSFTEYQTLIEPDLDGNPVVGDYLKMQFVEHQVVPTILV